VSTEHHHDPATTIGVPQPAIGAHSWFWACDAPAEGARIEMRQRGDGGMDVRTSDNPPLRRAGGRAPGRRACGLRPVPRGAPGAAQTLPCAWIMRGTHTSATACRTAHRLVNQCGSRPLPIPPGGLR